MVAARLAQADEERHADELGIAAAGDDALARPACRALVGTGSRTDEAIGPVDAVTGEAVLGALARRARAARWRPLNDLVIDLVSGHVPGARGGIAAFAVGRGVLGRLAEIVVGLASGVRVVTPRHTDAHVVTRRRDIGSDVEVGGTVDAHLAATAGRDHEDGEQQRVAPRRGVMGQNAVQVVFPTSLIRRHALGKAPADPEGV